MKVWQRLQRIESLAEQISAAQAANGPALEGTNLPLNALRHSLNRAARTGELLTLLLHGPNLWCASLPLAIECSLPDCLQPLAQFCSV